ncbi:redoxin domain protein [Nitzschia inconspicua]|uniref:Redoxin domain protein n=1 Tax=Nitzschia inconspicua TaxID=303405 RepID=A0A9K3PUF3_9STRA|nr:redoxin domain protein [Nitzschia inconspicua]
MKSILRCVAFLAAISVTQGFLSVSLFPVSNGSFSPSSALSSSTMSDVAEVKVGDKIPSITLMEGVGDFEKKEVDIAELIAGKKVAIFGVPGAFTPGCSKSHLPSFITAQPELKEKGVDLTICIATNDLYVMEAWGRESGGKDAGIVFLSDSNAELTKALGLLMDGGIMPRTKRFSLVADDGVVTHYFSSAEQASDTWAPAVLAKL